MNVLLFLPALMMNLNFHFGIVKTIISMALLVLGQILIGLPFLQHNANAYIGRAFEFKRVFTFKWSVNWQFLGEDKATSNELAMVLLVS